MRDFGVSPPHPLIIMSLSDQHPYAMFITGRLRSPSLARAGVDLGNNASTYLASADVVPLLGQTELSPPNSGGWFHS